MSTTLSYWEKKHFFAYDVLIAGSGIVGLNAAIRIKEKQPALSVAVLERGFIPTGASTKNAGFACFGSISELIEQEQACGTDGLHALIKRRWMGLQKLRNLLGDKAIDLQTHGGNELFRSSEATLSEQCVSKLGHFNSLIRDIVNQDEVFKPANHKISGFGFDGITTLIENKLEAQLDPGKMMHALITKAMQLGVFFYNNCTVNAFDGDGAKTIVRTNQGNFECRRLLLATNAFIRNLLPDLDIVPGRGQVVVTSVIPDLPFEGTFHYQKGYYYFRNVNGRVLLGGGRNLDFKAEETVDFGETAVVQDVLRQLLKEVILPGRNFGIDYSWSGIMAFGSNLGPIIDEVKPNVFCAARCSGMGIAIGSQTGEDAAEMVLKSL